MDNKFFLSICIPSYNRPVTLRRLLDSIDYSNPSELQIVICEDKSPAREQIRETVSDFKIHSPYSVKYIENSINLGFDRNWRELSIQADGEYLLYMGDDDAFIKGGLDTFSKWIKENPQYAYILRSYIRRNPCDNSIEVFKYYNSDIFFEPGERAYKEFFLKSVSMSGYTIKRESSLKHLDSILGDNTLLFQLYLLAEVCLEAPSAYCNTPCVELISDQPQLFGNSDAEKGKYTPGQGVASNYNFIQSYFRITEYLDIKHGINLTPYFKKEMSKYSLYILGQQRQYGIKHFFSHVKKLREIGIGNSVVFYLYVIGLVLFGTKSCSRLVRIIKKVIGRRPRL